MTAIINYIKEKYRPRALVVYGSYADGSNNAHSDFDALVIADCDEKCHDTSVVNGVQLDVFVYPPAAFEKDYDPEEFLQVFDGQIVADTDGLAAGIIENIRDHIANIPRKTAEEIADEIVWCKKMALRASRQDAEGLFRLHWLLVESLEIFCDAAHMPYFGPKKSLKHMEKNFPEEYACYTRALSDPSPAAAEEWISCIEKIAGQ